MRSSIVVGVDGSPAATRAARVAASFARRLDYRLVLAHVAGDPPVFPYGAPRARERTVRGTAAGTARAGGVTMPPCLTSGRSIPALPSTGRRVAPVDRIAHVARTRA